MELGQLSTNPCPEPPVPAAPALGVLLLVPALAQGSVPQDPAVCFQAPSGRKMRLDTAEAINLAYS